MHAEHDTDRQRRRKPQLPWWQKAFLKAPSRQDAKPQQRPLTDEGWQKYVVGCGGLHLISTHLLFCRHAQEDLDVHEAHILLPFNVPTAPICCTKQSSIVRRYVDTELREPENLQWHAAGVLVYAFDGAGELQLLLGQSASGQPSAATASGSAWDLLGASLRVIIKWLASHAATSEQSGVTALF